MPTTAFRKRPPGARCKRHGLVLVDESECALCKQSRPRPTSPWLIASLGGVVLVVLFAVRWLREPEATSEASKPLPASRPSVDPRAPRSRPAFERATPASARTEPAAAVAERPTLASTAALEDPSPRSHEALPVEDRQLGRPSATLEPAAPARRPPDAPGARGFPPTPRADDPADFD